MLKMKGNKKITETEMINKIVFFSKSMFKISKKYNKNTIPAVREKEIRYVIKILNLIFTIDC